MRGINIKYFMTDTLNCFFIIFLLSLFFLIIQLVKVSGVRTMPSVLLVLTVKEFVNVMMVSLVTLGLVEVVTLTMDVH